MRARSCVSEHPNFEAAVRLVLLGLGGERGVAQAR